MQDIKSQLTNTSSQDEFAKWAKLRRQHDKLVVEYDKLAGTTKNSRQTFDRVFGIGLWLFMAAVKGGFRFFVGNKSVFILQDGVFPYTFQWICSLPKAPLGK